MKTSKTIAIGLLALGLSSCAFQKSAGRGAIMLQDASDMTTNVEYVAPHCVRSHHPCNAYDSSCLADYAKGGIVHVKVMRSTIGAADTHYIGVTAKEGGKTLLQERGHQSVAFSCDNYTRWCNIALFSIPSPVARELDVFVDDLLSNERKHFRFRLDSQVPCK